MRGIRVPGGAALSRKQVDEIEADAKKARRARAAAAQVRERRARGAGREVPRATARRSSSGSHEGDLALFVAGPDRVSSPALDRVRQDVARRMNLIAGIRIEFLVGHGLSDVRAAIRRPARSAPCTIRSRRRCPTTCRCSTRAPERARALAYDCVFNGTELGGGSIRISDPALQASAFSAARHRRGDGAGALRLPARGTARRRAAARRHRVRLRSNRDAARRRRVAARRDRVSQDDRGARAVRGRAVAGAGRRICSDLHISDRRATRRERRRGHTSASRPKAPTRSRWPASTTATSSSCRASRRRAGRAARRHADDLRPGGRSSSAPPASRTG